MFKKIVDFWKKKLNWEERFYFIFIIITIFLSTYIAYMELSPIGDLNREINIHESKIQKLDEAINYNEHLKTLFSVYYSVGRSLESQRRGVNLDAMGATSIDLNFHMKDVIWQECLNINSLEEYLNETVNCSQIISAEAFFDKSELQKLARLKAKLVDITGDLKKNVSDMKARKQGFIDERNFLYVLLVFLSGIGIACNYLIERLHDKNSKTKK